MHKLHYVFFIIMQEQLYISLDTHFTSCICDPNLHLRRTRKELLLSARIKILHLVFWNHLTDLIKIKITA
jgi:hypothetical protein